MEAAEASSPEQQAVSELPHDVVDVVREASASDGVEEEGTSVLRLRGLPFSVAEQEIREFFEGFAVQDVLIEKRQGEPPPPYPDANFSSVKSFQVSWALGSTGPKRAGLMLSETGFLLYRVYLMRLGNLWRGLRLQRVMLQVATQGRAMLCWIRLRRQQELLLSVTVKILATATSSEQAWAQLNKLMYCIDLMLASTRRVNTRLIYVFPA